VPVEQIGEDLRGSLKALEVTLKRSEGLPAALAKTIETTDRTLASLGRIRASTPSCAAHSSNSRRRAAPSGSRRSSSSRSRTR